MNQQELVSLCEEASKIIANERHWRTVVFANDSRKRDPKVAEMDRLQHILSLLQEELEQYLPSQPEQQSLLDVPKKATYT